MTPRWAASTAVILWAAATAATQAPDLSTRALVASAAKYVAGYAVQFKYLIADEVYTQRVLDDRGEQIAVRRMTGELFLAFIPADREWIAVHDVAEVDGRPVTDREDLQRLLKQGEFSRVAALVANRNAGFNIGAVRRNFNEPTLPLLLFDPKRIRGVAFDRRDVVREPEATRVTLAFTERDRPTLIRTVRGAPIFTKGEILIDAATGRVERTALELKDGDIQAQLITDYALDDNVKLWVPSVFTERYQGKVTGRREVIECEARYSNYRRFEVTGRIK
jgi:hypothetical protein